MERTAKCTCTDTYMSLKKQPTQKRIPGHDLRFRSFCYNLFKKQKKNGLKITKKAYPFNDISGLAMRGEIMALVVPDVAAKSHDAVLTYNSCPDSSYVVSSLLAYIIFFAIQGITRYFWRTLYSSFINFNVIVMPVMSAMISRSSYTVVIATTVLFFLKLLQIPKFLLHYVSAIKYSFEALLTSTGNQMSFRTLHNTTSASPKWKLIYEDDLSTVDVYSIEGFCVSLGILLVWRVLCRLFFFVVHRFCSKNDKN